MIVYHVPAEDCGTACTPVRYESQTHLMQLVDRWALTHSVHYNAGGVHCVVYCSQPLRDLAIVVVCNRNVDAALVRRVTEWLRTEGQRHAYTPPRDSLPSVCPTPNAGSSRTDRDLHQWCDTSVDAFTHYHVLVNVRGVKGAVQ